MTDVAVSAYTTLGVAGDAKTHIHFMNRLDSSHRLNRSMAGLTFDTGRDMGPMAVAHKIGKRIYAVPADLKRRLLRIHPRARDRFDSAYDGTAVTSDASLHRRNPRSLGASCVLVAVLARNLRHPGMKLMAEGNRLDNVGPGCPRALRETPDNKAQTNQRCCEQQNYAVHVPVSAGKTPTRSRACDDRRMTQGAPAGTEAVL